MTGRDGLVLNDGLHDEHAGMGRSTRLDSITSDTTHIGGDFAVLKGAHSSNHVADVMPDEYGDSSNAESGSWTGPGNLCNETRSTTAEFVASHREEEAPLLAPIPTVPRLNIVIFIVGSRGDVQPYLALALALIIHHGHRVRIATHPVFRDFVVGANARLLQHLDPQGITGQTLAGKLEFFDAGGDPKSLMEYMVRNPRLWPGIGTLASGDIGRKKRMTAEMLHGFYRSTYTPDDITGRPFAADAIISNPPVYAHFHIAEALGIPLHMTFTMPWTASTAFPHPLIGASRKGMEKSVANYLGFGLVNNLMWHGLGGVINDFRKDYLLLDHIHQRMAPSVLDQLKVPWPYCWSPDLLPKPSDWRSNIDISGFYFLDDDATYVPSPELEDFLGEGPAPIYIGFGSIPIPKPERVTKLLFSVIEDLGIRAIISSGWAGLGADLDVPDNILILTTDVPHEWLFSQNRVAGVVHHGGAGTTACGLRYGRPTAVIPFFGDQLFWGDVVFGAGAGPPPIPYKVLKAESLAKAIQALYRPEVIAFAARLGERIRRGHGEAKGADSFHRHLPLGDMVCDLDDTLLATLYCRKYELRLSSKAAGVLLKKGVIYECDLLPYRTKEYDTSRHNFDPLRGIVFGFTNATYTAVNGIGQLLYRPLDGVINITWGTLRDILAVYAEIYEGLDNLPHLIGAASRTPNKVAGFGTGLAEGLKMCGWGFYDGVVGLVADPIDGARREGGIGFIKGCGRGGLNLMFRPIAGSFALIALPGRGVVRDVRRISARILDKIVDPRKILLEPRIALARASVVFGPEREDLLAKFDRAICNEAVKAGRKRRRAIQWVLTKDKEIRRKK